MNIARTDFSAAARSGTARRGLGATLLVVLLAGMSVSAAHAGERWSGERDQHDQRDPRMEQRDRPPPPPVQQAPREMPPQREARPFDTRAYDMRLEEARRQQAQQQQDGGGRRGGRLTPDERRELRRQINEAGMDLYPNTPRR